MKNKLLPYILLAAVVLCSCSKNSDAKVSESVAVSEAQENETEAANEAVKETESLSDIKADTEILDDPDTDDAQDSDRQALIHLVQTDISKGKQAGSDYEGSASVDYPVFHLTEADAIKYPELEKALNTLNKKYEDEYAKHLNASHELAEAAVADGSDMQIRFFDSLSAQIRRADSRIVSIFENYSSYSGGVHGYYAFYGDNIDPETGNEITLNDVVSDADSLREMVKEKLYSNYPEVHFDNLDTALADICSTGDMAIPWTMDYSGVTLYFNPYHLASYADGMQVITVPFNENPDIFNQKYLEIPESFVQQLDITIPLTLDINGDGINEALFITEEKGDAIGDGYNVGYAEWIIDCGDKSVRIADGCYYGDFYLVYANGQYYVYVFEVSDNDYSICTVVDLNKMECRKDKNFNASLAGLDSGYEYNEDGYTSTRSHFTFTDPGAVELSSRIEVLGSNGGRKVYHTGSDGWPVSDDRWFNVSSSIVLTAKQDVSCAEVDENGTEKSDALLKEGMQYVLIRTDNKSWADIQEVYSGEYSKESDSPFAYIDGPSGLKSDRPIYRIPYDDDTWPHTIYDSEENEVFDGIMYAG